MSNMLLDIINETQAFSAGINPAIFRGSNAYLHIRFAPVAEPTDDQISVASNEFIGLCANHEATAPTDAASYIWERINYQSAEAARVDAEQARVTAEQGRATAEGNRATAEQGRDTAEQNRATAEQGRATSETARKEAEAAREAAPKYLHVRYSAVAEPTDAQISTVPNNYIGTAVTANATAPTTAASYTWARWRGLDGAGAGDMLAEIYDADGDGIVDVAKALHEDATIQQSQVDGLENALGSKAAVGHTHAAATQSTPGYMSTEDKTKLDGVDEDANNYTHPEHPSRTSGLYKVTVDNEGHVTGVGQVVKDDITGLGIPGQDTVYSHPTGDGNLHIPATGTGNSGKVLKVGASAGSAAWGTLTESKNVTLAAGTSWSGSAAPYTQTMAVTGVTATNNIAVGLAQTATKEQIEAWGACLVWATGQGAGTVTFTAMSDKPAVALPVVVIILG